MALCMVIGVGPDIGIAAARRFAKEGYDLVLIARSADALQTYARDLRAYGVKVYVECLDVADSLKLQSTIEKFREGTDVLIYNASVVERSSIEDISLDKLQEDFLVNVGGAFVACRVVIPHMVRKRKGTILFTGGGFAHEPNKNYVSLSAGKAGLLALSNSLADRYEPEGIHIATVTVWGKVGTPGFEPERIAKNFWYLHTQSKDGWDREVHVGPSLV